MKNKKSEKGQIIVILAISMVAILAITALAIDGSLVYNQRRTDQSTADSATMAGAGAAANLLKEIKPSDFSCGSGTGATASTAAVLAAQASAGNDGVTLPNYNSLADLLTAKHGVRVECGGPDETGSKYLDVIVMVSSESETTFAKVISVNTLSSTVQSIARVYPIQPLALGNGLVSCSDLCSTKQGGIEFGGTGFTFINAAGVFSNSCIKAASSSTEVTVVGGEIQYMTDCFQCDTANMVPDPVPAGGPIDCENMMAPPTCTDAPYVAAASSGTLNPGNYTGGINTANGATLTLNPGLYCIKGGMSNNAKSILYGNGVTLYFLSGDVTLNTNDKDYEPYGVQLYAPDCYGLPTCGLLMYFDQSYSPTVKINGGAKNSFEGTIFAPTANITLNGGAATSTFNTQIVANWIEVTGKSQLIMDLDDSNTSKKPASLSLIK